MNYAKLYALRAQRAVESGTVDFNAFVEEMLEDGVSPERLNQLLVEDLEGGGPIFGKFFRDITSAGETAISVAEAQASSAAESMSLDDEIAAFAKEAREGGRSLQEMAQDGDPEALEQLEILAEDEHLRWIATLRSTCPICLSLHGKDLTRREWRELGYRPRTVHRNCECDWIPVELAANYQDIMQPLRREIVPGQTRGGKRTQRAVTQQDVDASIAAREKALETKEGRRILRAMGRVGGGDRGTERMEARLREDRLEP